MNGRTDSAQCHHPDVQYHMHMTSMTDSNVGSLKVTARCNVCEKRLNLQRGVPMGASSRFPTAASGEDDLGILIPVIAEGEEPTKEWGFAMTVRVMGDAL